MPDDKKPSKAAKNELTDRQKAYVTEYIKDQNVTAAAKRAGISLRTAQRMAANDAVILAIKAALEKAADKAGLTKEYIIKSLLEVVDRCMQRKPVMYFDYAEKEMRQETCMVKDDATGEIREEGVWQFDARGANKALELLGKNLKMFTDRVEITKGNDLASKLERARKRVADVRPGS